MRARGPTDLVPSREAMLALRREAVRVASRAARGDAGGRGTRELAVVARDALPSSRKAVPRRRAATSVTTEGVGCHLAVAWVCLSAKRVRSCRRIASNSKPQ